MRSYGFLPRSGRNHSTGSGQVATGAGEWACQAGGLRSGEFSHGGVEAQAEDLDEEVDGVAALIPFGPAPVAVFDDETGEGGHEEVVAAGFDEWEPALFKQGQQRREPGGADLFPGPTYGAVRRAVGHSLLFSSPPKGRPVRFTPSLSLRGHACGVTISASPLRLQWGWMSTRLTCFRSTVRV